MATERMSLVNRERGAGFVELLVIVALAGVILAIASPALQEGYQRQKSRAVATEAIQAVRYVRLLALKERVPHRILFHDASGNPASAASTSGQSNINCCWFCHVAANESVFSSPSSRIL